MQSPFLVLLIIAFTLCHSAYGHGDTHEIIHRLTHKIKASPNNAKLYLERSDYYFKHKDFKLALKDLETVEKLDPSLPGRLIILAKIHSQTDKPKAALSSIDAHITQYPKEYLPYKVRSQIHTQLKQHDLAEEDLATAIQLHPRPPLSLFLSLQKLYEQNGKVHKALKVYDDAERALGTQPALLEAKAQKLTQLGKRDQASATYQHLRNAHPTLSFKWWSQEAAMWQAHDAEKSRYATRQALDTWSALPSRTQALPHFKLLRSELEASLHPPLPPSP